jgi:hypothetical protein
LSVDQVQDLFDDVDDDMLMHATNAASKPQGIEV